MIEITDQSARVSLTARVEKHGPANVPAATLKFKFNGSNDFLSNIDPTMKPSIYRRPHKGESDIADGADTRLDDPNYLPCIKHPNLIGELVFSNKVVGATLTIDRGLGDKSNLVLSDVTADNFKAIPLEGGTCSYSFDVDVTPSIDQAGPVFMLNGQDVVLSLDPPREAQASML